MYAPAGHAARASLSGARNRRETGEMLFRASKIDAHASYTVADGGRSDGESVRCQVLDLSSTMQQLNHDRIDVLKMDVEGR
jgi:hypothetical protein